jgi:hypothetical protein
MAKSYISRFQWLKFVLPFLPAIGYTCVVLALFFRAFTPPPGQMIYGYDYSAFDYYLWLFIRESLVKRQLPLWNPYIFAGIPFLEHPQIELWYPINVLYLLLPPQTASPANLAIHILIAMTSMYWLMRRWIGKLSAWFSGIAYGMSTYFWYRIPAGHNDIIAPGAWAPLVFGLFYGVFWIGKRFTTRKGVRLILLAGIAFALQIFSGYRTTAILTAEAVGIACFIVCIKQRSLRPVLYSVLAGLIGLLLASVELLGNLKYMQASLRSMQLPYSWAAAATPTLNHLLEIIDPVAYLFRNPNDLYLIHERAAYVGSITLVLALVAIMYAVWHRLKRPEYWIFAALCVFGLWVGFAYRMPVDLFAFLHTHLPWYQGLRISTRHFFWFVLGASALGGLGAHLFVKKPIQIIFIGVLLWQLVPLARSQFYMSTLPGGTQDPELISYLQKNEGLNRFLGVNPDFNILKEVLNANAPFQYHIYSLFGYSVPSLRNYTEYVLAVNHIPLSDAYQYDDAILEYKNFGSKYTDALNIKYILEPTTADSLEGDTSGKFEMVKENTLRGWRLYENHDVLPRFYMVPHAQVLPTRDAVYAAISGEKADPRETVLIAFGDGPVTVPQGDCQREDMEKVEVIDYSAASIRVRTNSRCAGILMSSEIYYPGWEASLDGSKTDIWEGNLAFRAVYVPAGVHTITFRYIPRILYVGMLISFVTILLCGACFIIIRQKRSG